VIVGLVVAFGALINVIACAPAPTLAPVPPSAGGAFQVAAPTSAPAPATERVFIAPTPAPAGPSAAAEGNNATIVAPPPPGSDAERKIIKSAQIAMTVQSTDFALNQLTGIASDAGGYILSTRTFFQGTLRAASITFAVPVDRFEEALRRTRGVAAKIDQDTDSGQDVTDQYVDLQSQLTNLQATSDRIRGFLDKAKTVDEALKINDQLSIVQQQIETVKGKMNYMQGRAAFSTLTVDMHEPPPTPTPTPVVSPQPTLTPTPTPTPAVWRPEDTLKNAANTQGALLRVLTELIIWVVVVFLPYAIFFGLIAWVVRYVVERMRRGERGGHGSDGKPTNPQS
jgi:hypothetical protein